MDNLKKEYKEIKEQRNKVIEEIKPLKENEIVKRYFELKKQNDALYEKQLDIYQKMKKEEYKGCNHILVYSEIEYDRYEGRKYRSCGCIKCGLDESVRNKVRKYLPFFEQVMYDYLRDINLIGIRGNETNITCNLALAQAIYSKIKETHPDIDDDKAIKYFSIALDNIRNIDVSEERKVNRAKRLSLNPNFKDWYSSNVYHD